MSMHGTSTYELGKSTYSRFNVSESTSDIRVFVREFKDRVTFCLKREQEGGRTPFRSFVEKKLSVPEIEWLQDNTERFFKDTANQSLVQEHYLAECGFICSMIYTPDGENVILGHASGLIQMRHGSTGTVLCTLRNIQFPPKPVHALEYSPTEPNICYAACMDGVVYRIEIPHIDTSVTDPPGFCIRADPLLDSLNMQFYGSPGISSFATPFTTQRYAALSLGVMSDLTKMAVGYGDTSIKVYDMEAQETLTTYKVHKLRLQFVPKKLQRMHFGQVVAVRAHPQNPFMFASGAWDKTLRIWDVRCQVGCVMTFEGVNICSDSIDLNREHCIAGSWSPTSGLSVWDLTGRKLLTFIKVQNRRLDVDGEYIYACRYWRSTTYNRKGKYAVIGGSGTNCLEVINLHNRYISCSYPTTGAILALTSHQERIAFGGTSSAFNIVSFYDPKYQKDKYDLGVHEYDYSKPGVYTIFHDDVSLLSSADPGDTDTPATPSSIEQDTSKHVNLKQDTSKQGDLKQDTSKQGDVKQVTSKQSDVKQVTSKQSDVKQVTSKQSDVKQVTSKQSDVKQDTSKHVNLKQDTSKQGDVKQDTSKHVNLKQDVSKQGDVKQDTPKQGSPKQGTPKQDTPKQGNLKQVTSKQSDIKPDTPKRVNLKQDDVKE